MKKFPFPWNSKHRRSIYKQDGEKYRGFYGTG